MNRKIHFFNMIEVLLALTVIAIGMTSVLGLFPVGLNASRNAVAQNCSADVADQMITYMRIMGESIPASPAVPELNYKYTFTDSTTSLPDYTGLGISYSGDNAAINLKSGSFDIAAKSEEFLTEYKSSSLSNFQRVAPGWAVFTPTISPANLRRRVYFIIQGPNCTEDSGNRNIDYSAMALVWKSTVQINCLKPDGDPTESTHWVLWPSAADAAAYKYSGKLNIELSWPLELPYKQRKKRYYQVVITNPNP